MFFIFRKIYTFFFRIAQEYYSNDTSTMAADQVQTVDIEQGMNFMNLENDWEELENYENEVKGESWGKQFKKYSI